MSFTFIHVSDDYGLVCWGGQVLDFNQMFSLNRKTKIRRPHWPAQFRTDVLFLISYWICNDFILFSFVVFANVVQFNDHVKYRQFFNLFHNFNCQYKTYTKIMFPLCCWSPFFLDRLYYLFIIVIFFSTTFFSSFRNLCDFPLFVSLADLPACISISASRVTWTELWNPVKRRPFLPFSTAISWSLLEVPRRGREQIIKLFFIYFAISANVAFFSVWPER